MNPEILVNFANMAGPELQNGIELFFQTTDFVAKNPQYALMVGGMCAVLDELIEAVQRQIKGESLDRNFGGFVEDIVLRSLKEGGVLWVGSMLVRGSTDPALPLATQYIAFASGIGLEVVGITPDAALPLVRDGIKHMVDALFSTGKSIKAHSRQSIDSNNG